VTESESQRHSLRRVFLDMDRRLTLGYGGLVLALMLVVLVAGGVYLKSVMEREEERLSTLITQVLASSVSRISFSGKYHARLLLEEIQQRQPGVNYILLADRDGVVLAHSDPRLNDSRLDPSNRERIREVLDSPSMHPQVTHIEGTLRTLILPYRGGYANQVQGVLQIGLDTSERNQALHNGLIYMGLLVLVLLLIATLVIRRLSAHFARPARTLANDMSATLQAIPDLLFELDTEGRYHQVHSRSELPHQVPASALIGRTIDEVLPEEAAAEVHLALHEALTTGESHGHQVMLPLANDERWYELSVALKPEEQLGVNRFILISRDITERYQAQRQLLLAASVFDNSREGILVTDADQRILRVNPAFTRLTGFSEAELLGLTPRTLQSGHHSVEFYQEMWHALDHDGHWQGEVLDRCKSGTTIPVLLAISTVRDSDDSILHYVAIHTDISELKKTEAELEHQAHHDPLTGLSNRIMLHLRLEHALARARRDHTRVALLMLDLDRFKDVNDSFGHLMGDILLREVALRLQHRTRSADTISRLGGDEFTLLLEQVRDPQEAARLAADIIQLLSIPVQLPNGNEVSVGVTIGIALFPEHGNSEEALLQGADSALYQAKADGRGRYRFFSDALTEAARERLALESRLRQAIPRGELSLHFQPQYRLDQPQPFAAEALLRWQSEEGPVSPVRFIPVAEQTGLIEEIGAWVLTETCRLGREWLDQGLPPLRLAVNVSPRQFQMDGLVEQVAATLAETGFPPEYLELEITEGALMSNEEMGLATLRALRDLGIRLAIDDFGTGYSSLAYLKRFPIDLLKIDKTFIDDIPALRDDMEITATIIGMAHTLRMQVIAEGVETQAQLDFLAAQGCDYFQGYLRSRPLPVDQFTALLLESENDPDRSVD